MNTFVIAMELGEESLADRLIRRISTEKTLELADQAIAAVAYAHRNKVIHCDIKPENFIIFPGNQLKLTDFGFAKISIRTLKASGSGTIDYIAPEQAMGRPKFQSDVFSLGLVLYRMLSGKLPQWPFNWPMIGNDRLMSRVGTGPCQHYSQGNQARPCRSLQGRRADACGFPQGQDSRQVIATNPLVGDSEETTLVAETALAGISVAVQKSARHAARLSTLPGSCVGDHAALPLVRH